MNPMDLLKDAKKMQAEIEKIGEIVVTGAAGAGMVEVDMNGKLDIIAVRISPEVANPSDIELLQDLIISAVNDASNKTKHAISDGMGGMMGGLDLSKLKDLVR